MQQSIPFFQQKASPLSYIKKYLSAPTDVDVEKLKIEYEKLKDENIKLQKQVDSIKKEVDFHFLDVLMLSIAQIDALKPSEDT